MDFDKITNFLEFASTQPYSFLKNEYIKDILVQAIELYEADLVELRLESILEALLYELGIDYSGNEDLMRLKSFIEDSIQNNFIDPFIGIEINYLDYVYGLFNSFNIKRLRNKVLDSFVPRHEITKIMDNLPDDYYVSYVRSLNDSNDYIEFKYLSTSFETYRIRVFPTLNCNKIFNLTSICICELSIKNMNGIGDALKYINDNNIIIGYISINISLKHKVLKCLEKIYDTGVYISKLTKDHVYITHEYEEDEYREHGHKENKMDIYSFLLTESYKISIDFYCFVKSSILNYFEKAYDEEEAHMMENKLEDELNLLQPIQKAA